MSDEHVITIITKTAPRDILAWCRENIPGGLTDSYGYYINNALFNMVMTFDSPESAAIFMLWHGPSHA